jgi:CTP synthase (UTP-ammonia lyase)
MNITIMQVKVALVGKYTNLTDSYLSVVKVGTNDPYISVAKLSSLPIVIMSASTKF